MGLTVTDRSSFRAEDSSEDWTSIALGPKARGISLPLVALSAHPEPSHAVTAVSSCQSPVAPRSNERITVQGFHRMVDAANVRDILSAMADKLPDTSPTRTGSSMQQRF
jgi:hypothetical protein